MESAEGNAHVVCCADIGELDMHVAGCIDTPSSSTDDTPCDPVWVLDDDFATRQVIAKDDLKAPPCPRDTKVEMKPGALYPEPKDPFSMPARYIQPADQVYQVQSWRPTCGGSWNQNHKFEYGRCKDQDAMSHKIR